MPRKLVQITVCRKSVVAVGTLGPFVCLGAALIGSVLTDGPIAPILGAVAIASGAVLLAHVGMRATEADRMTHAEARAYLDNLLQSGEIE